MKHRKLLQFLAILLVAVYGIFIDWAWPGIVLLCAFLFYELVLKKIIRHQIEDPEQTAQLNSQQIIENYGEPDDVILVDAVRGNELDRQVLVYVPQKLFLVAGIPLRWDEVKSITFNNCANPYLVPEYQVIIATTKKGFESMHLSAGQDISWAQGIAVAMEKYVHP